MNKFFLFSIMLILLTFTGCTSTGLFGVITTNEVLDARLAEMEEQMTAKQNAEIEAIRAEVIALANDLEEIHETARELNTMIDTISATEESTRQLQELAKVIEERLNNLPQETLKGIIEILNNAVEE